MRRRALLAAAALAASAPARAQIDPETRDLAQAGYEQSLSGPGPLGAYAFYYLNRPGLLPHGGALRLALSPVYVDAEAGFPRAGLALGLFGGGFAYGHEEVRAGRYHEEESFTGHGGGAQLAAYPRLNPGARIPLCGVLRLRLERDVYADSGATASGFVLPPDHLTTAARAGVRWGGSEPVLEAEKALELSAWYEARLRDHGGAFGFAQDRLLSRDTRLYWGRALISYASAGGLALGGSLTAGGAQRPDRLNAYRLGGGLTLAEEFPLAVPGYRFRELSARGFALLAARAGRALDAAGHVEAGLRASLAFVDALSGVGQAGSLHAGAGPALDLETPGRAWKLIVAHGYGFAAKRGARHGAHSLSLLLQFNFRPDKEARPVPPPQRLERPSLRFLRHPRRR